jgi:hypothetical protein
VTAVSATRAHLVRTVRPLKKKSQLRQPLS